MTVANYLLAINFQRSTTDPPTFQSGSPHSGFDALDNETSFQFRNRSDDDHDGSAESNDRDVAQVQPKLPEISVTRILLTSCDSE
jgi:hypothetical protein